MTMVSVSPSSLKDRRSALGSQRRFKIGQSLWRFLAISSLAGASGWLMTLSYWMISQDSQIEVRGLQLMSSTTFHSLVSLSYPQSLWRFPTHQLSQQLETSPPVARAMVTRQLFPPKVVIQVTERQPIAIAASGQTWGFLDEQGIFIPKKFYNLQRKGLTSPTLKVIGYEPIYRSYWQQLYPLIHNFSIKIFAIDWQDSSNLVLITELGNVRMGDYTTQFSQKLSVLAKMRHLSTKIPVHQIVYIDLSNPNIPVIQLKQQATQQSLNSLVKVH